MPSSKRTFTVYFSTCERVVRLFGKNRLVDDLAADDFDELRVSLSVKRGQVALGNEIRHARLLFKYAYDAGLVDRPVRFGPNFKMPSKKVIRQSRQQNGKRMFEADELRQLIKAAKPQMMAMILLGANCGFGQTDISGLPQSAVNLDGGWIDYPRPKTAVERRCPLWPETIAAVHQAITDRSISTIEANSGLCFITKYGNRWVSTGETGSSIDSVALEFAKLLKKLDLKRVPFSHKRRMGANLRLRNGSKPAGFPPQLMRDKNAEK